ncbi:MAG: PHP domain-containing protein [Sphaerochaetaceae bacterium]
MRFCIDLHNHSCLSPCGSDVMLPSILAMEASDKGIDILALTDHNCARNLGPFAEACEIIGITGVFGIEVNTVEEIHVLALFETLSQALEFGKWVESILPKIKNSPRLFGKQYVCDVAGNYIEEVDIFLYGQANVSFDNLIELIIGQGGLAIPAHIDRPSNSVTANLGFLPRLPYSAVESIIVPPIVETYDYTVIQGSDAHYMEHIGRRRCYIEAQTGNFAGLKEAFLKNNISFMN